MLLPVTSIIGATLAPLVMCCLLLGAINAAHASADFPPDCAPLGPYACSNVQATSFRYTWQPNCYGPPSSPTEAAAVADRRAFITDQKTCSYSIAPATPWRTDGSHVTIVGCQVIVFNGQLPRVDAGTGIETYNARTYNTRHNYRVSGGQACAYTTEETPWLIRSLTLYCPPGMGTASHNGKRYCRGSAFAKALGEPQQCSAVGNPIHSSTGNKYQREADYAVAGSPLVFERHYNSITYPAYAWDQFTAIGKLWRHTTTVGSQNR